MRLQRRFLEKAGHTVTVVAPAMHGARARRGRRAGSVVPRPAVDPDHARPRVLDDVAGTPHGSVAGCRAPARIADTGRPRSTSCTCRPTSGARSSGTASRARHGLPVVHTMHNRVDVGIEATAPFPGARAARAERLAAAGARRRRRGEAGRPRRLGVPAPLRGAIGCRHRAVVALRATARGARRGARGRARSPALDAPPTGPRRRDLERHRRRRARRGARRRRPPSAPPGPPRFVWLGRMSPEKRLLPVPRGARRVGRRRRRRGDRRRRAAARGAAPRRASAGRARIRHRSRAGCRTPRPCGASRPPTPSCRPRSASRRRA